MSTPHADAEGLSEALPSGIGKPATRALIAAGYTTLGQLTAARRVDLARLHGVGPKALAMLDETLRVRGLAFTNPA